MKIRLVPTQVVAMKKGLLWLRKGLRLHDHGTLAKLVKECGAICPVYILDRWHEKSRNIGDVRFEFLMQSLRDLDKSLRSKGSRLLFVRGEPEVELPKLWQKFKFDMIGFDNSEENEIHCVAVDKKIKEMAKEDGVTVVNEHSHWLHSPKTYAELLNGKPYPMTMNQMRSLFQSAGNVPKCVDAPEKLPPLVDGIGKEGLEFPQSDDDLTKLFETLKRKRQDIKFPGGETEALKRLHSQVVERKEWVAKFEKPKTAPNAFEPSTTALSPYLTHGCLSVRKFYHAIMDIYKEYDGKHAKEPENLVGQIMFRELWYTIGALSEQDISKMEGNDVSRQIPWDYSEEGKRKLEKWEQGQTGYPFIDAIMNQLRTEGWIHHLARHAVACFATRGDLWVPWDWANQVFDRYLIDADWTLNSCNWMWLSCSAFFYQYFRCYSPVAFGKKTDPKGKFIRKYVPQLKSYPDKFIYEPWKASLAQQKMAGCIIGKDYPEPIVKDHTATSKENMDKMHKAYEKYKKKRVTDDILPKNKKQKK